MGDVDVEGTQSPSEDLLFKVLENEYKKALDDVLAERRKITEPEVCNVFNLWYLSNHVHGIQAEMREGFAGLRQEMEERFAGLREEMEERFEKMEERFEKIDQRFKWVSTLMEIGFSGIAVLIVIFQFVGGGG